jgi:hypothetical protein
MRAKSLHIQYAVADNVNNNETRATVFLKKYNEKDDFCNIVFAE